MSFLWVLHLCEWIKRQLSFLHMAPLFTEEGYFHAKSSAQNHMVGE
jgi:hypothetical protein